MEIVVRILVWLTNIINLNTQKQNMFIKEEIDKKAQFHLLLCKIVN